MVLWIYNFDLGLPCLYSNFRFSLNPRDIKIKFDTPFPQVVNVSPIIYYFIKNETTICVKERNYKYGHINPKGGGGGSKSAQWVFDWLPFLTGSCYGHKNS